MTISTFRVGAEVGDIGRDENFEGNNNAPGRFDMSEITYRKGKSAREGLKTKVMVPVSAVVSEHGNGKLAHLVIGELAIFS